MLKSFKSIVKNEKGASLVTVIIATAAIVSLSVVLMQARRIQQKRDLKTTADNEVALAVNKLSAMLNSYSHCNAFLKNRGLIPPAFNPTADHTVPANNGLNLTLTAPNNFIKTCNASNCDYTTNSVNSFEINGTSWDSHLTGFPITGTESALRTSRVRIKNLYLSIDTTNYPYPRPAPSGDSFPWTARLWIRFEKNLVQVKSGTSDKVTTFVDRTLYFPVTLASRSFPFTPAVVSGCPRSPNTTTIP